MRMRSASILLRDAVHGGFFRSSEGDDQVEVDADDAVGVLRAEIRRHHAPQSPPCAPKRR
jgi:hypothetical protein